MIKAPIPKNEKDRLCAVNVLGLLDTEHEERFDLLTKEVKERFQVPMSTLTIVDKDREWFKSSQGVKVTESPRDISFCGHALLQKNLFVVEDTLENEIFKDNPMVLGPPFVRFYAGKSLFEVESGLPVGVFCIKDVKPRKMSISDISDFLDLASRAEKEINKKL